MIKVDLGCGIRKRGDDYIRIDNDPMTNPDYVINLDDVNVKLPFEDSTVDEISAYHILEHIGEGFLPLMKEIYRVCKNDADIYIEFPHYRHHVFFSDPTHKRPLAADMFYHFSKKYCDIARELNDSSIGLAYNLDIDITLIDVKWKYDQLFAKEFVEKEKNIKNEEEYRKYYDWILSLNEVVYSIFLDMKVVK